VVKRGQWQLVVFWSALVVLIAVIAAAAGLVAPHDPYAQATSLRLKPPGTLLADGAPALLGTDQLGRDILSRMIWGARVSLIVGGSSVLLGGLLGVVLGLISGYFGGWPDQLIMRVADVQLAFPSILLAIALAAVLGPGLENLIVALGLTRWVVYARLVRGSVLGVKEREFVSAARALGANHVRTMARHILPNVVTPVIIVGALELGRMIIAESSLSFLGLGVPAPTPTWGGMVADGRNYLHNAWWVSTFPGLAVSVAVLAVGLLGDALRDALDPRFNQAAGEAKR
jgi:peptide/nickel transport system permease protein